MEAPGIGWLPIHLDLGERSEVSWLRVGSRQLTEPFFRQSVAVAKYGATDSDATKTDLSAIISLARNRGLQTPAGLIFHVSRCGSTLIANALKHVSGTVVVSEAQPFEACLASRTHPHPTEAETQEILRSLATAFARYSPDGDKRLVIKFTSFNILQIGLVRACWPTAPCLVVVRSPVEVIVSNLLDPGGWMRLRGTPDDLDRFLGYPNSTQLMRALCPEDYCARVIGMFCDAAWVASSDPTCRVIDYAKIDSSRLLAIACACPLG
jgi:hypothetical protein